MITALVMRVIFTAIICDVYLRVVGGVDVGPGDQVVLVVIDLQRPNKVLYGCSEVWCLEYVVCVLLVENDDIRSSVVMSPCACPCVCLGCGMLCYDV